MSPRRGVAKPFVECPYCGQKGDEPPGFRLSEYEHLQAVVVPVGDADDFQALVGEYLPQRLECRACAYSVPVARGSVVVVKKPSREASE